MMHLLFEIGIWQHTVLTALSLLKVMKLCLLLYVGSLPQIYFIGVTFLLTCNTYDKIVI